MDELAARLEAKGVPRNVAVDSARAAIDRLREPALRGESNSPWLNTAEEIAANRTAFRTRPCLNLTGILLHTGLGRAQLAESAANAVAEAAKSTPLVEFDLEDGRRGDRQSHVEELLVRLSGAEAALVVNNCAAAVILALSAIASGKEVILSRGEMVEIGGAFRMPDIVLQSGCRLVEVGCTNRTRLSDYERALTPETGAILRCHPSNFAQVGFVESTPLRELVGLGVPVIDDVGSGCLVDVTQFGLTPERTLRQGIEEGAAVLACSGDKLLGGPQAGILLGRRELIQRMKRHPLARALRIDKLVLAGLEATLQLYDQDRWREIPLWRSLGRSADDVRLDAERLAKVLKGSVVPGTTEIGGGSLPGRGVPTWCAASGLDHVTALAKSLRQLPVPMIGRIEEGRLLLDPRGLSRDEMDLAVQQLEAAID